MAEHEATLIAYDTDRDQFSSLYERNKFYRGLFGYKQKVKKNGKVYRYEKQGLIGRVPNIKVEDSVIIVADRYVDRFIDYLDDWQGKVDYTTFRVMLDDEDWEQVDRPVKAADDT
ncbi:MAG: hypothetical protein SV186_04320 [Candidatus Nanohaloarchaea archaeon]|nr:hypothetical protein [Candidatus Nanohaloarchaea archaeon]